MDAIPIYTAPAAVDSVMGLSLFTRAVVMAEQFHPLPSVFVLAMTDKQWRDIYNGLPSDVARFTVQFAEGLTVVIPWDTTVTLEPGLTWETTCISQGWLYNDPPGIFDPNQIPIGPQHGLLPSQPNFTIADLLFVQGSWQWLLWA